VSDGIVIDQRFRLGRVIRESGVAVVYEAKHRNGAEAWIKLPRAPEHAGAITTEAQVANALGKNAVNVRDDGVTESGLPYLVQEPVFGQRLDHWRESSGGRAPPEEAMAVGDELCQAIGTMHQAGFAVGLLRADAIIVVPKGGICLLELEHARPATLATMREDVVRVGRVLYEMLSGAPSLAQSPPLHDVASELPRAMTATIDDAARGRFATIAELRTALRASMPESMGPMRRPMPSVVPDVTGADAFDEIVLPRSSKMLFDPSDLVDSTRNLEAAALRRATPASPMRPLRVATPAAPMRMHTPAGSMRPSQGMRPSQAGRPSRPSIDLEAPPVAAFERVEQERPAKRSSMALIVAGVSASAALAGSIALVVFALSKDDGEPRPPAAKAATSAVVTKASATASVSTPAPPTPAVSANDVIEVDDAPPPPASTVASAAVDASTAKGASDAGASMADSAQETAFRFEGSLSPRLVIVDGTIVGTTTKAVRVRCGTHSVKIGGKGVARSLDLPCGGEQGIVIESNGTWNAASANP
jgi:hypothetical protein